MAKMKNGKAKTTGKKAMPKKAATPAKRKKGLFGGALGAIERRKKMLDDL